MKRRILKIFAAIVGLYLLTFGIHVGLAAVHAKNYLASLSGEYDRATLDKQSANLATDVDRIFTDLNLPVVKQIAGAFGLDFTPIRDEVTATIKASSWLAGADAPKRYMIAFQNSAEARGTGGILGAFAIVEFNKGRFSVIRTGSNAQLKSLEEIPIRMPKEYTRLYGSDPAIWQNSNLSPHFPYGAKIWMELWRQQYGDRLDGIIAVDPTLLSYILNSTGPVKVGKSSSYVNSRNLVNETLRDAYKRYEFNNNARKQYLVEIMNSTFSQLLAQNFNKVEFGKAMLKGILENRLLIYTNDSKAENFLQRTKLGGYMQVEPNNEFRVVIQNIDASKLDFYLDRKVLIKSLSCKNEGEIEVKVYLKHNIQSGLGLPSYVLTRADKTKPIAMVSGQHRFLVFVYGPTYSKLIHAKRSSSFDSPGVIGTEREREILVVDVDLAPGQSENITATFTNGKGPITYISQPLVRKETLDVQDNCA